MGYIGWAHGEIDRNSNAAYSPGGGNSGLDSGTGIRIGVGVPRGRYRGSIRVGLGLGVWVG